jgi:5-methylthioadenosine/S-adenosylhomocysteine deaminase
VLPGLVQTHLHLCQTVFRGLADDLTLLDWLQQRVWPLEAAHTPATLRVAARLAAAELLRTGTTSVLTMETVHDTDAVVDEVASLGLRATIGKCMMDGASGTDVPSRLREGTQRSIDEGLALHARWDGAADGRIRIAFAPRFAISCTRDLLDAVGTLSRAHRMVVHTHASESRGEIAIVRRDTGLSNMAYLDAVGLASPHLCAAHCVWVDDAEIAMMATRGVKVLHCPGSNLKLGSGVAPIVELQRAGVCVSIGADGAACNNRLDMFDEMRLTATLQAMRLGPGVLPARDVVWMATRGGARALGLDEAIGSIEPGKLADVTVVGMAGPHLAPGANPYSTLVYAARGTDVRHVVVDGHVRVRDGALTGLDPVEVTREAREAARVLMARAGL